MRRRAAAFAVLLCLSPSATLAQEPLPTLRAAVEAGEPPAYIGMRCAGFFAGGLAVFGPDLPEDLRERTSTFVGLLTVTTISTLEAGGIARAEAEEQTTEGLLYWAGVYEALMRATPDLGADPLYAADSADCLSVVGS